MMNDYRPGAWGTRIVRAILLLLGIAVAAHLVYELIAPLIPVAVAILVIAVLCLTTVQRWRR